MNRECKKENMKDFANDYLWRKKDRKLRNMEVYEVKNPYPHWKEFDYMMDINQLNEPHYRIGYFEFPHNTSKKVVEQYMKRVFNVEYFYKYNNHVYAIMYMYDC